MKTPRLLTRSAAVGLAGFALVLAACQPTPPVTPIDGGEPTPTTVAPTTPVVTPSGWTLVGGDEFDGGSLDTSKWKPYHNTYGDGNNELACLTPDNVRQGGGSLKITAERETVACPGGTTESYTSGFIGSRETGTYYPKFARFEIRAKLPHAQGLWPAFWLRHRNGASTAEVDIMEYFHSQVPGRTTQTLHLDGRYNISKKTTTFENAQTPTPGWHTWAVEILPDPNGVRFTFFLDGSATHTFVDTQHDWASSDPASTWDIAVNLAVGGKWVGVPDDSLGYLRDLNRCSISGTAPNGCSSAGINRVDWSDPADSTYEVDWVRVYTK